MGNLDLRVVGEVSKRRDDAGDEGASSNVSDSTGSRVGKGAVLVVVGNVTSVFDGTGGTRVEQSSVGLVVDLRRRRQTG